MGKSFSVKDFQQYGLATELDGKTSCGRIWSSIYAIRIDKDKARVICSGLLCTRVTQKIILS